MLRRLILFLALSGWALAQDPATIVGPILSRQVSPGVFEVKITVVVKQAVTVPQVPIIASYLRFVAPMPVPGWLQEDNLLGSLYQVDLSDNGALTGVECRETGGVLRLDHFPVVPMGADELGPQTPYNPDGSLRRYTLGPDSPDFMVLFCQPPWIGLDLQHRGYDPEVEQYPNPCLQIYVYEPCVGPSGPRDLPGEPNFTVGWKLPDQTDRRLMFNWEPNVSPQWIRTEWKVFPINNAVGTQDFVFEVNVNNDTNPVGVMAQINYSLEPGVRRRGAPVLGRLWQGGAPP